MVKLLQVIGGEHFSAVLIFSNALTMVLCSCTYSDDLKELFRITFSEEGSLLRPSEEQAWVHFGDFLDECEGN